MAGEPRGDEAARLDGRRARSQRSRERILDALEAVLQNPDPSPVTPEAIIARAGLSMSTLFRHFGDTEGVARAMRERLVARVAPIAARPFEGDARARLVDLVGRRRGIFEIVGPLRRAADRGLPEVREQREEDERGLNAQVRAALEPELAARGEDVAELVQALLSFETWSRLRIAQGLDPDRSARIVRQGVAQLLDIAD